MVYISIGSRFPRARYVSINEHTVLASVKQNLITCHDVILPPLFIVDAKKTLSDLILIFHLNLKVINFKMTFHFLK